MQARDLMSTTLTFVPPEMPVKAVAELLAARGISAVPVVGADSKPVGIVTEGDLIRRLADEAPGPLGWFLGQFGKPTRLAERFVKAHGAKASDVMTKALVSVAEDASVEECARLMEQHRIKRVPVLRDGRLVGIVSRADLLRAILRPAPAAAGEGATADTAILRQVLAAMREQPWVDTYWTFASVSGGVVSLYGFMRSEAVHQGLLVLVQQIPGVLRVEDHTEPMPLLMRASL